MANRKKMGGRNALDDLVMLEQIKEEKILESLKNRYMNDLIYTNIGPVLIAINPFTLIKGLYTENRSREYRGKKHYELPPHVYALADAAYSSMISYRENQCVIITGESGSGKTETSKIIMQYISMVSGKGAEVQKVKERMLGSNPVLESFGNAKTINNNNSSRFGKYMEILFDYGGDPVGGRVTNYLLEKSRVVQPTANERNFHIFYMATKCCTQQERQAFYLEQPDYYYYLNQSGCFTVDGIDDHKDYQEMLDAMTTLSFSDQDKQEILRAAAVILWLGNIEFREGPNESSQIADTNVSDIVANLLQIDAATLTNALCNRKITTGFGARKEVFNKPNNPLQAEFTKDTLAKAIYSKMFDWIVKKVNQSIAPPEFEGIQIGVLDIYGFEIFDNNGFEQLCINFVNEKLQQIFIDLTMKAEQDEYAEEGIKWTPVKYYNNLPVCQLIENKPGVISICNDCCNTSKTDAMFAQDLSTFFGGNKNIFCSQHDFSVNHYAGQVRYTIEGFLTKNKDTLFEDLTAMMQSSPVPFVKETGWFDMEVGGGQQKRPPTVGTQFKKQVGLLMAALRACTPHYIRCVKPNHAKTPRTWEAPQMQRQVKYLGLLENIRVRRAGYAYRAEFSRFVARYKMLNEQLWSGKVGGDIKNQCHVLARSLGWTEGTEYAMGKTKIFIQDAMVLFNLEDLLDRKLDEAVVAVQAAYRSHKEKRHFMQIKCDGYDLVNNKKQRRRGSVSRDYKGDYVSFSYNKNVSALLQAAGPKEKVVFADRVKHATLAGKKSFFSKLFGSAKDQPLHEPRFILISDKAVYSFSFIVDPETGAVKTNLFYRIGFSDIQSITVSPLADNYFLMHFFEGNKYNLLDTLQTCRRKTEMLAVLQHVTKQAGGNLNLQFLTEDKMSISHTKKRVVVVKWVNDGTIDSNSEALVPVKKTVEIHVPDGVHGVQAPEKPTNLDVSQSNRPKLKALYDCPGNGTDELGFKAGDVMLMLRDKQDGWYEGSLNNKAGFVPETYVEKVKGNTGGMSKKAASSVKKFGGAGNNLGALGKFGGAKKEEKTCDWVEQYTDDGDLYYYNQATGDSVWDRPAEMGAAPAGGGAAKSPWVKQIDPSSGSPYYYNEVTDESSWDPPPGWTE